MDQGVPEQTNLLALGIDAGGTATRWALVERSGQVVAEGRGQGFSALDLQKPNPTPVAAILADLTRAVLAAGRPVCVHAGLTGFGTASGDLIPLLAGLLDLPHRAITLSSDFETAYLDLFAPGQGYLVYAGTGSVAAFLDDQGVLHRAGGRGVIIDDAGGGYWIAQQGLRHVWRAEDEQPGSWRASPMAEEFMALVGGSDWAQTQQYVYNGSRGEVGRLALAVAHSAARDPVARDILSAAGRELARLALTLLNRFGPRPVALGGGAAALHTLIAEAMHAALPAGTPFELRICHGEHAAARLALCAATGMPHPLLQELHP
jgi:N-acetylglucosamine kinase-like BadF-type ATPase